MPSAITQPTIQRFPASETSNLIDALTHDGCVIISDFTTQSEIDEINAETRPYLLADKPWKGALFPPETRRCPRLVARSSIARKWLVSPNLSKVTSHFLAKTTSNYYGNELHTYTTQPIVNTCLTMEIGPGAAAQRLHRDDKNFHTDHKVDRTETGYVLGSETGMGILVPGVDTRVENGATRVVLGSHLWGMDRVPQVEECVYAEMKVGEAFVMLGSVYHAGGQNSTVDEKRPMHALFFCQGILRTEENHYLTNTKEEILSWSPEVQEKMGFFLSSPNIGFCDFRSPVDFLRNPVITTDFIPDTDPEPEIKIVQ